MTGPRIDIGLGDDEAPRAPRVARTIDRQALKSMSETHGFDRPVSTGAPARAPASPPTAIDGRTLRATGRSAQMNTKVRPEVRDGYQYLSVALGISIGVLLEEGLALLKTKYPQG